MIVKTKFDVGDSVWAIANSVYHTCAECNQAVMDSAVWQLVADYAINIYMIHGKISPDTKIRYGLTNHSDSFLESNLFASRAEAKAECARRNVKPEGGGA